MLCHNNLVPVNLTIHFSRILFLLQFWNQIWITEKWHNSIQVQLTFNDNRRVYRTPPTPTQGWQVTAFLQAGWLQPDFIYPFFSACNWTSHLRACRLLLVWKLWKLATSDVLSALFSMFAHTSLDLFKLMWPRFFLRISLKIFSLFYSSSSLTLSICCLQFLSLSALRLSRSFPVGNHFSGVFSSSFFAFSFLYNSIFFL